jgi:hypothetical protein
MKSMNKSALMFGVLALGGLVALSAPASAAEDYDHGSAVEHQIAPWFFDQVADAQQARVVNADQVHGKVAVESGAQRRARIAAETEARRLQE